MNSQDALKWNQLILSAIDGTISPQDFALLDNEIRTNPKMANHYVEFMLLYTGLRQPGQVSTFFTEPGAKSDSGLDMAMWNELATFEKTAETVEQVLPSPSEIIVAPASVRIERKLSRISIYTSIISIAALLLMGVFVFLNPRTTDSTVGVLTKAVDTKWHDGSAGIQVGDDLYKGSLQIEQGLAQIRFDSGASVILEGPARVELLGGNSMNVLSGKIVATVGREAIGFVVNTPQGKILDLGTEFGIQVNPAGQSQVHVFTGEVLLYPTHQDGHVKVPQGDAKSVDQDGRVDDIPLREATFVRQEEMDSKLLARLGNSYHRWKNMIFTLHRDPSLAAHYFGVKDESQSDCLLNLSPAANGAGVGHFGAQGRQQPTWVAGRWSQKSAVRFERGKNQSIVIPADPALAINGPITIATWVYYPNENKKGGHLVSAREEYHANFQFSVFDSKYIFDYQGDRFEFLRFNQKKEGGLYSQKWVQPAGVWTHLAVTHDMQNVCFYVNGRLFETLPYTARPEAGQTEIVLGSMKLGGKYVLPEGDFDGVVDELLIFNRCLGGDEVLNIYQNGLPVSGEKP